MQVISRKPDLVRIALACTLAVGATTAQAAPLADADYVGQYQHGTVDTMQQLVILEDHTFCYAVMAGSLDLLAGGRWKAAANPAHGIELKQIRPDQPVFQVLSLANPQPGNEVVFDFDGYSFSQAESAVFAVSATETPPANMRPLFPEEKYGWSPDYELPAMQASDARYFFIGYAKSDTHPGSDYLDVTRYELGNATRLRIGFDRAQATPPLEISALLSDGELQLNGESFGSRSELPADLAEDVRKSCITPALSESTASPIAGNAAVSLLPPDKEIRMGLPAEKGTPWFPDAPEK